MDFISNGLESLDNISKRIINLSKKTKIITFQGEIGSGKTTLIKRILYNMNVKDLVKSPTYTIVNEHLTFDNKIIYHFDFFRIQNEFQALEIGFDEYIGLVWIGQALGVFKIGVDSQVLKKTSNSTVLSRF